MYKRQALAAAARSITDAETYRVETFVRTELLLDDGGTVVIDPTLPDLFEYDGDRVSQLLRSVGPGFIEGARSEGAGNPAFEALTERVDELVVEQIVTPDALYQLNHFGEILAEVAGAGPSPVDQLFASGEWLRVDPAVLGLDVGQLAAAQAGASALGPELLGTVESIPGIELEDLGVVGIDGTDTRAFRTELTFGQINEAGTGFDPTGSLLAMDDESAIAELSSAPVTITIHVDRDLQARRIEFVGTFPTDASPGVSSSSIDGRADVLDVDDPSIEVATPERWTDATDAFRSVLGLD